MGCVASADYNASIGALSNYLLIFLTASPTLWGQNSHGLGSWGSIDLIARQNWS